MATTTARQLARQAMKGGFIHSEHRTLADAAKTLSREQVLAELGQPFAPALFPGDTRVCDMYLVPPSGASEGVLLVPPSGASEGVLHRRAYCRNISLVETVAVDFATIVAAASGRRVQVGGHPARGCPSCLTGAGYAVLLRDDIPHAWAATEIAVIERLLERSQVALRAKAATSRQQGRDAHRHAGELLAALEEVTVLPGQLEAHRRRQEQLHWELAGQIERAAHAAADTDLAKLESRLRKELGVADGDELDCTPVVAGIPARGVKDNNLMRTVLTVWGAAGSDTAQVLVCPVWVWGWIASRQQKLRNTASASVFVPDQAQVADTARFTRLCTTAAALYQPQADSGLRTIAAAWQAATLLDTAT